MIIYLSALTNTLAVTPAKAGVHLKPAGKTKAPIHPWIPACAGMTDRNCVRRNRKTAQLDIHLHQLVV
jgi:hypothetical protein